MALFSYLADETPLRIRTRQGGLASSHGYLAASIICVGYSGFLEKLIMAEHHRMSAKGGLNTTRMIGFASLPNRHNFSLGCQQEPEV
ncbi:hypothetical protein HJFPF1_10801 [Paramyrothecium foliicola]|nr:hypothetical protein HJFPF1_10801 [Paramyrothecium foliicola]